MVLLGLRSTSGHTGAQALRPGEGDPGGVQQGTLPAAAAETRPETRLEAVGSLADSSRFRCRR